jgi:hypothetical protein
MLGKLIKYKKPPIVERAIVFHAEIDEETFHLGADTWRSELTREFPNSKTITEWMLGVTEKDGMPFLDPDKQQISVRQLFSSNKNDNCERVMQLWRDKIAFNLKSDPATPSHFEDISAVASDWLPKWVEHFKIATLHGITLQYVNLLSAQTLPSFMKENKLMVGEVLTNFSAIPGRYHELVAPFDFQLNVRCNTEPVPMNFCARLLTASVSEAMLHVHFTVTTTGEKKRAISQQEAEKEIQLAHALIVDEFEAFFTSEAKNSFEPYAPTGTTHNG